MEQKGIQVGALWKGEKSLNGFFGSNARMVILPNKFKKQDKHPDYIVMLFPAEKKEKKQASNNESFGF